MVLLLGFALSTCVAGLGSGPRLGDHESIVALSARESIESGHWLVPQLGAAPCIRKTPLGIWLAAAASWLVDSPSGVPVSEFSARLPSALAGTLNSLVVCWLGVMMFGWRAGLVAGFICAGCAATILYSHNAQVDMLLTLCTTLSFACFWRGVVHEPPRRGFLLAFGAALGLAMLAKAPLPLVIIGASLAVYWCVTVPILTAAPRGLKPAALHRRIIWHGGAVLVESGRQLRRLPWAWFVSGMILFVLLAGAWPIYVYSNVENAGDLWRIEYLDRYRGEMSERSQPFLFYIPILFGLMAPFLLSIPEAMAAPFLNRYRPYRRGLAFAFTWAVIGTLFLSTSSFKRLHYLLSVIPAYCLLLGPVIDRLFLGPTGVAARRVQLTCWILPAALAGAIVAGGVVLYHEYPSLLRVYALIAVLAFVAWAGACGAYARGWRITSLGLLHVGVIVIVLLGWPAAGRHVEAEPEVKALVAAFREHGVRPDDAIFWVEGRPDASIEFYWGFRIRRLIDEIEMAKLRGSRRHRSPEMYAESARRIGQRLAEPQPVYLILSAGNLGMLERHTNLQPRVLARLGPFHEEPGDELVIVTQAGGETASAASQPVFQADLKGS